MSGVGAPIGAEVFSEPTWFPDHIGARGGELDFIRADREAIAAQAFLDQRWTRTVTERRRESVHTLLPRVPHQTPPLNWLWHTGLCCSTLLAKAITRDGRNLALCEPQILLDLADMKRAGFARDGEYARLSQLVFHLLSRAFVPGTRVTAKPTPAANVLIGQVAAQTSGNMVVLYSDCRSFLISVIKMGEGGRRFVRNLLATILGDGNAPANWDPRAFVAMTDIEAAAVAWHLQIAQFLRVWPTLGPRVRSLDCDAFLDAPATVLSRLDRFLSLNLGEDHIREVTTGALFKQDAKRGVPFSAARRREEQHHIATELGPALDRIVTRSYDLFPTPRGVPLPEPIAAVDKTYCAAA